MSLPLVALQCYRLAIVGCYVLFRKFHRDRLKTTSKPGPSTAVNLSAVMQHMITRGKTTPSRS